MYKGVEEGGTVDFVGKQIGAKVQIPDADWVIWWTSGYIFITAHIAQSCLAQSNSLGWAMWAT